MPSIAPRGRGRRTIAEINMVPFIDVMLVLLIIFMVTAPLITPSVIDLPRVGKAARQPDRVVQVLIGKDEGLEVREGSQAQRTTLTQLVPTVQRAVRQTAAASTGNAASGAGRSAATVAVVISADRNVKYELVVRVMDQLQRAGVERVGLSVQMQP